MPYMKKMIYSGKLLEIEKYPITNKGNRVRVPKFQSSSVSQANLNKKNSLKQLIRLVECNYTEEDLFITLSYKKAPSDKRTVKKDFQNFVRRLKYHCKKEGLPEPVVLGKPVYSSSRPHHHLFLNFYELNLLKKCWGKGRVSASYLERDEEYGFSPISKYFASEKNESAFSKRWCASRNLKKPKEVKKQIKRLNIYKPVEAPKGYKIISVEVTDNVFTGTYQYIRCVKIE